MSLVTEVQHQSASKSDRRRRARPGDPRRALTKLMRGRIEDPRWVRPSFLALLFSTAALYLFGLERSRWANGYYSAAIFAATKSWRAMFFGSLDPGNFISVDKPPAALWLPDLTARVFGLNAWSVLVPQALEGVAAVALLYATVRRHSTPLGGLLGGAVLATTPVATLMFRYNNPDALLVLLLVATAYALTRAIESGDSKWVIAVGTLLGFAFLVKLLQAFLVVPPFALAYLLGAPGSQLRRFRQLLVAGAALLLSAGWWLLAVALTSASSRPYIGGSQTNNMLELTFGYNGFGRLTGKESGSPGTSWGFTGGSRLFADEMGTQISWLLPAALMLLAVFAWRQRRLRLTDAAWTPIVIWGGWLLVTAIVFSYAQGIVHPYYTVALAPAIGAVIGISVTRLWSERSVAGLRLLAGCVAVTVAWTVALLNRTPMWQPWMRLAVVAGGFVAVAPWLRGRRGRLSSAAAALGAVVGLMAPVGYSVNAARTAHDGAIPTAGPPIILSVKHLNAPAAARVDAGVTVPAVDKSVMGGMLQISRPSHAAVRFLLEKADDYRWVAATPGGNNAAGLELATRRGVIGLGGFNATDPSPTLDQFQRLVAERQVHYFVADDTFPYPYTDEPPADQIAAWVERTFPHTSYGKLQIYDLTASLATGA